IATVVGEWRGHYRSTDGYDLPLRLVIKEDSFEAGEGEPIRRRFRGRVGVRDGQGIWSTPSTDGTLGLHQDGGRRSLAGRLGTTTSGGWRRRPAPRWPGRWCRCRLGPRPPRAPRSRSATRRTRGG